MNIFKHIPWFRRGPALPNNTVYMEQMMKGNPLWGANPDRLVRAVTGWQDAKLLAEVSSGLGKAMVGINADEIKLIMEERGK